MVFFVLFQQVVHVKLMYDKESSRMRGKHINTFEILIVLCLFLLLSPLANASSFRFLLSMFTLYVINISEG